MSLGRSPKHENTVLVVVVVVGWRNRVRAPERGQRRFSEAHRTPRFGILLLNSPFRLLLKDSMFFAKIRV